ncbi:hypothetical protein [Polyangium spumosum]|uniref:Secreted protein n=1 Tax=Polyangium spumosum TaxID=889282 RepID=A0A6N7Q2J4_9BACT|nr:hypothetical protein [Polyangium spumosum]MRG97416.1 hypothetical protein [Polyangium spumosum]
MTRRFVFRSLLACFVGVLAAGCVAGAGDEETDVGLHELTRDGAGNVVRAETPLERANLDPSSVQEFGRAPKVANEDLASVPGLETQKVDELADSCSGWCNATSCSCTGSLSCCLAGCSACWGSLP